MKLYKIKGKGIFTHSPIKEDNNDVTNCWECALYISHTSCRGVESWLCNEHNLPEGSHFIKLDKIRLLSFLLEEIEK